MNAQPRLRSRILPAVAAGVVAGALAGTAWYGYHALAARPIARVILTGDVARLPPEALARLTGSLRGVPTGSVSLPAVREAARRIPWVRDASVRRRFPDAIEIAFEAHQALARWGDAALVSPRGEVFAASTDAKLPRFTGPDGSAPRMVQEYPAIVRTLAPLASPVAELHLSARDAWQVVLASGLVLELGRGDIGPRLERFARAWPGLVASGVQTRHADLRYDNGFALRRISDASAAPATNPPTKKTPAKPPRGPAHRP